MPLSDTVWEDWKKVIVTLPDSAFFTMAKHYLGELETPFTKQNLVRSLISKVSQPVQQEIRRTLLTPEDLETLTAVHVLTFPLQDELAAFLGRSTLPLRQHLMNLEERLLVYWKPTRQGLGLALTPVAENDPELMKLLDPSRLYPSVNAEPAGTDVQPLLAEGTFLSLLSFLMELPLEKGLNGAWKKKARQEFLTRFEALGDGQADGLLKAAENLGLVLWSENRTHPVFSYWDDLAKQTRVDRAALLAMAAGPWSHTGLYEAARHFWAFYTSLDPARAYTKATLVRLSGRISGWGTSAQRESLVESWIVWGYLHPGPGKGLWQTLPGLYPSMGGRGPSAVLQANFDLRIPVETSFETAYLAIQAARLVRFDRRIHFELDKQSFKRALGRGIGGPDLVQAFETLSGKPLSQNLKVSLKEWEKEFESLRLWRGTVLTVAEDRRHLVEHTEHFRYARILAPGVYLVAEDLLEPWSRELEQKGLPPLPPVHEAERSSDWGSPWSFSSWKALPPGPLVDLPPAQETSCPDQAAPVLDRLFTALEALPRPEEEKEELRWRIRRRLVLDEVQLQHPLPRGERLEAKGLDYLGKLRLAEQALNSTADFLEIVTRDQEGRPRTYLVRPQKLEKHGGEILLHGEGIDPQGPFKAFVSSLSLVKKIRGSLFH